MSTFLNDIRYALRQLRKKPGFTAVVVLTLALGIGINTTIFTFVNAMLFKPLPIPRGDRLVVIDSRELQKPDQWQGISYPDFLEYRTRSESLEGLEALCQRNAVISDVGNPPESYRVGRVSVGLFDLLRISPVLGRGFTSGDGGPAAAPVVLIGHRVWQGRYGGASDVVGRVVRINGLPTTIVGVMPAGLRFPNNKDMWLPLEQNDWLIDRSNQSHSLFGILKEGTSLEEAKAELAVVSEGLSATFPETNERQVATVLPFRDWANGSETTFTFLTLLGAVGFVWLIACANVANMLLGRGMVRSREFSVRTAIGANRWQIVRQLLIESIVLSLIGGLLGLALSVFGVRIFDLATQHLKSYWVEFTIDYVVVCYLAVISVTSAIIFGLVPALRSSKVDIHSALKEGTRMAGDRQSGRWTGSLVVVQLALTVVLLACAGMMMRSLMTARSQNDFVPANRLFTAGIRLPAGEGERYADPSTWQPFFEQLLSKLEAIPGVTHAAAGSHLPGLDSDIHNIEIEGRPNGSLAYAPKASFIVQTANYLSTIQLPILSGRGLRETDGEPGTETAVVTRAFSSVYWPNESAIGQRFRIIRHIEPSEWITVVGVCADIVQNPRTREAAPLVYIPYNINPWNAMSIVLRTTGDPAALAKPVRLALQSIEPDLPLMNVSTLQVALAQSRQSLRVFGVLFSAFAGTSLLMASVGIYGVIAQHTARRTREIGVRMALGSTTGGIVRLVLSPGLRQLTVGLVLGLVLALGATRLMEKSNLLYRISGRDPWVFTAVPLLLMTVGLFACWLPARRAAKVDPMEALRYE